MNSLFLTYTWMESLMKGSAEEAWEYNKENHCPIMPLRCSKSWRQILRIIKLIQMGWWHWTVLKPLRKVQHYLTSRGMDRRQSNQFVHDALAKPVHCGFEWSICPSLLKFFICRNWKTSWPRSKKIRRLWLERGRFINCSYPYRWKSLDYRVGQLCWFLDQGIWFFMLDEEPSTCIQGIFSHIVIIRCLNDIFWLIRLPKYAAPLVGVMKAHSTFPVRRMAQTAAYSSVRTLTILAEAFRWNFLRMICNTIAWELHWSYQVIYKVIFNNQNFQILAPTS